MLILQKIPYVKQIYQTDLEEEQLCYILNIYGRRPVNRSWRFKGFFYFRLTSGFPFPASRAGYTGQIRYAARNSCKCLVQATRGGVRELQRDVVYLIDQ